MKWKIVVLVTLAAAAVAVTGCSKKQTPLSPELQLPGIAAHQVHRAGALADPIHLAGSIGPGALYSIDVPADWNGDLVLYAHGYTYYYMPVEPPGGLFPDTRDGLLALGYAVAATSFSENGYALAEGVRQVHQLRGLFVEKVGEPTRTWIIGTSLGGLIGLQLEETYVGQYAGVLSVSGPVGGTKAEFNYVGDVRNLWDLLMCDLPGTLANVPAAPFPLADIMACMQAHQNETGVVGLVHRQGGLAVEFDTPGHLPVSVANTLGFHWVGMMDALDRTRGHMLYDNHDAVYVGPVPAATLAWINANIARYTATPDAFAFLQQHYEPTGRLTVPFLALHSQWDFYVPRGHEDILLQRVTDAGRLPLLAQFSYNTKYGHTEVFTGAEVVTGFEALVEWVDSGNKPTTLPL